MSAAVACDVLDRLLHRVDDATAIIGARYSVPSPPPRPARSPRRSPPREASVRSSPRTSTPASPSAPRPRQELAPPTRSCTSSVSAALQTPGRCVLAFTTIASALSRSASHRHTHGSCPRRRRSRARWRPPAAPPSGSPAARDDQIEDPRWVASSASSSRPPPATRLTGPRGRPAYTAASAAIWQARRWSASPWRIRAGRSRYPTSSTAPPHRS